MKVYCVFEEHLGYGDHDLLMVFDTYSKAKDFVESLENLSRRYCIEIKEFF